MRIIFISIVALIGLNIASQSIDKVDKIQQEKSLFDRLEEIKALKADKGSVHEEEEIMALYEEQGKRSIFWN